MNGFILCNIYILVGLNGEMAGAQDCLGSKPPKNYFFVRTSRIYHKEKMLMLHVRYRFLQLYVGVCSRLLSVCHKNYPARMQ